MGVAIRIGYPTRKPLVPGKREPTALEMLVLRSILHGDAICAAGAVYRTCSQARERLRRLGLVVRDEKAERGWRLTQSGYRAVTVAIKKAR